MVPVRPIARVTSRRVRVAAAQLETQQRINQHPDPDFIKETLAKFPEEGIANIEQCLVSDKASFGRNHAMMVTEGGLSGRTI